MSPIRTCVGCRQRGEQQGLHRFVRSTEGAWAEATLPRSSGRGAYLCSLACAQRVMKNKKYPGLGAAASLQKKWFSESQDRPSGDHGFRIVAQEYSAMI
jgi:predicted RNA-binding protein YlxR (DUF448 family)